MRTLAALAAACLAFLAATTPAAAQTPADPKSTSDVDPGAVRYFDPEGEIRGRIEKSLPFDVPFFLRIPVKDDVQRMTGRYVGDTDPLICDEVFPRWRLNVKYADYGARAIALSEQRQELPIGFTRFVKVTEPTDLAGRYAELNVVRGLLPNRYYCFEFTRVRKAVGDPEKFREEVAEAIDELLRQDDDKLSGNSIPEDTYRQLRQDLIDAIKARLEPGERLVPRRDRQRRGRGGGVQAPVRRGDPGAADPVGRPRQSERSPRRDSRSARGRVERAHPGER